MKTNTNDFYNSLDPNESYQIGYSGGKDSLAVIATYMQYLKSGGKALDMIVTFADTGLESHQIYQIVDVIAEYLANYNIKLIKTKPDKTFWIKLFTGLPCPDHSLRWCTTILKINPMSKLNRKTIVGTHLGESTARDNRLKKGSCGGAECGTDLHKNSLTPILHWRNCEVWDYLAEAELLGYLPSGIFDLMCQLYAIAENEKTGSTRMGCMLCPVVAINTIQDSCNAGLYPEIALTIRQLLEKWKSAPRIKPVKKNAKRGATTLADRKKLWDDLQPYLPEMLLHNLINADEITTIDKLLADSVYPKGYTTEHLLKWEDKPLSFEQYKQGVTYEDLIS